MCSQLTNLMGLVNESSRLSLLAIGVVAFAGGLTLLTRHKRQMDEVNRNEQDHRVQRFEQQKFRRRSLASTMIASMGILMVALYWARDPYVFASLISVVLILLLAVMFLAFLDMMSVSLRAVTDTSQQAREALVKEFLRQREKTEDAGDHDGKPK